MPQLQKYGLLLLFIFLMTPGWGQNMDKTGQADTVMVDQVNGDRVQVFYDSLRSKAQNRKLTKLL